MTGADPRAAISPTDHRVVALVGILVALVVGLAAGWHVLRERPLVDVPTLEPVNIGSAQELAERLDSYDYNWPPRRAVPAIEIKAFPPDLDSLSVPRRKSVFFRSLLPLVLHQNAVIRDRRQRLRGIFPTNEPPAPGTAAAAFLERMRERYRVTGDLAEPNVRARLLRRVDAVPPALALAQAATESGWGTSRFTREGNNLFGEWTWNADEGMIPQQRAEGATHRVRIFPDLQASVRAYTRNLNTGDAYREFRRLRATRRQSAQAPTALELAGGLRRYSERGSAYVREIRSMIRHNGLDALPQLTLRRGDNRR